MLEQSPGRQSRLESSVVARGVCGVSVLPVVLQQEDGLCLSVLSALERCRLRGGDGGRLSNLCSLFVGLPNALWVCN